MSYGPLYDYDGELGSEWWGYFKLGPVRIPPIQPTVGMTDRAGTGQVWYLMWDGIQHLLLTSVLPASAQNFYVFPPYDGPYIGQTGWRLGVTTATQPGAVGPAGSPHLVIDVPGTFENSRWPDANHPLIAPDIAGQTFFSVPESTGWPTPVPPLMSFILGSSELGGPAPLGSTSATGFVPGIPSTIPPPTGGGYAAFEAAFATNSPPLVSSTFVPPGAAVPQPWHLIFWVGAAGPQPSSSRFILGSSELGGPNVLG